MPFLLISAFRGLVDVVHVDLESQGFPGVRATHGFAMQAIGDGCSSVELGERLGVTRQAAAKTVRSLEDLGFVTREPSPDDGRVRTLVPTERGREMLRLSAESFRREIGHWRARVGDDAVDTILSALTAAPGGRRSLTDLSDWS